MGLGKTSPPLRFVHRQDALPAGVEFEGWIYHTDILRVDQTVLSPLKAITADRPPIGLSRFRITLNGRCDLP